MLLIKKSNLYTSHLFNKFINKLIYKNLKKKIEHLIYNSFFYWKKLLGNSSVFYFFESLLKIRPLINFYIYTVKKKKKKQIKIKPYFMSFRNRWHKAIYWLSRSLKMDIGKQNIIINMINELYNINFLDKSQSLKQKAKHYKTILSFKTSKNFKW